MKVYNWCNTKIAVIPNCEILLIQSATDTQGRPTIEIYMKNNDIKLLEHDMHIEL